MEILSAEQVRAWDEFTMAHEPILSIDLMERAAAKCFEWLDIHGYAQASFTIFCGKGNNGGDGLALARMLSDKDCLVAVYILEFGHIGTSDGRFVGRMATVCIFAVRPAKLQWPKPGIKNGVY